MFDKNTKVLVVDDSQVVRSSIRGMLVENKLSMIVEASDGNEAWELITAADTAHKPFGLIISDINMPVLDGLHLLAKFRAKEKFNGVPFMLVSARGQEKDIEEGLALGASRYISKPFTKTDFKMALEKLYHRYMQLKG